jgi:pimeloyl-ACP methyl ester carboxylesterase
MATLVFLERSEPHHFSGHPTSVHRIGQRKSIDALSSGDAPIRVADPVAIGERISEIRAPTLVIAGDSDILIPPENGGSWRRRSPGRSSAPSKGRGYLSWISHPNETYSAVAEFLEGNETISFEGVRENGL